jgi:hypothetical protein
MRPYIEYAVRGQYVTFPTRLFIFTVLQLLCDLFSNLHSLAPLPFFLRRFKRTNWKNLNFLVPPPSPSLSPPVHKAPVIWWLYGAYYADAIRYPELRIRGSEVEVSAYAPVTFSYR